MFTGLIKEIGKIQKITPNQEGVRIAISSKELISEIAIDDSVAVNGCCLTAVEVHDTYFVAQAVHVTLSKTNLKHLRVGNYVNMELALRASDRLGGHFVQGHVNTMASLSSMINKGNNYEMTFNVQGDFKRYMIAEGSITIDGISLTIARLDGNHFTVSVIPHTWENTCLKYKKTGDLVNIEVDVLAKYLENFMLAAQGSKNRENSIQEILR